jgi:hypothetical protein
MEFEVFIFSEKNTCFAFFVLRYEFNPVHVNLLILKGDGQIYFVTIIISSVIVFILQNLYFFGGGWVGCNLSFCHILGTSKILSVT